jgi:methionine aminotransferase
MEIQSKLTDIGVTIFAVMSKLANEHRAINLSQGFPEFDANPALIALVEKYLRAGKNQYAPMAGIPELRDQIATNIRQLYGADIDPASDITVTSGATEALYCAFTSMVRRGDEVILFEPAYDSYHPAITLSGGVPVYQKLTFPDYSFDWDQVKAAITNKTKLIVINSPHNPSGSILSKKDIDHLIGIVRETKILIISDEVYEHIVFDGRQHESMLRYPELAARSFVISSFGKTYHTTGWKVGYCVAPRKLMTEFQKVHQYVTYACNTPVQFAMAEYLTNRDAYLDLPAFYQRKRDRFLSLIKGSRFNALPCQGTYFQMLDYSAISDEPDMEFAKRLTVEKGVASIPPSVFYSGRDDFNVLRFCFAKNDDTLERAAEILNGI